MLAGAATRTVTPELGSHIQGATTHQLAKSVRDPLEANLLYLADGATRVLLASVDVVGLERDFVIPARQAIGAALGLDPRCVMIAATHTHNGPSVIPTCYGKPVDSVWLDHLADQLVEAARAAAAAARPVEVAWGVGHARLGYNRRCCWADGTHSMHGDPRRADFTGLEGPDDPQHLMIAWRDADGQLVALLHHNTSHPTCFYGADCFSADFPGVARGYLREALGPLPVLFCNGAFGDLSIGNQAATFPEAQHHRGALLRAAHLCAGETLRLLHDAPFRTTVPLAHAWADLPVAVRLPTAERLAWAGDLLGRVDAGDTSIKPFDILFAHGAALLHEQFGDDPVDHLALHALRVGDIALATQPCELYCQFGLDLRRRSPAPITTVWGICDGYSGYCPTLAGIVGGGYSGEPIYWTRLADTAGYQLVDAAARLIRQLWAH